MTWQDQGAKCFERQITNTKTSEKDRLILVCDSNGWHATITGLKTTFNMSHCSVFNIPGAKMYATVLTTSWGYRCE
jgi:hypothetical protein